MCSGDEWRRTHDVFTRYQPDHADEASTYDVNSDSKIITNGVIDASEQGGQFSIMETSDLTGNGNDRLPCPSSQHLG